MQWAETDYSLSVGQHVVIPKGKGNYGKGKDINYAYEHVYSPIRQTQTEKYRYIQRDTKLNITKYIIIEMGHQITNSFMQWNKNSLHALITVKNHERPEYIMQ